MGSSSRSKHPQFGGDQAEDEDIEDAFLRRISSMASSPGHKRANAQNWLGQASSPVPSLVFGDSSLADAILENHRANGKATQSESSSSRDMLRGSERKAEFQDKLFELSASSLRTTSGLAESDRLKVTNGAGSVSSEVQWLRAELQTARQVCSDMAYERDKARDEARDLRRKLAALEDQQAIRQRWLWNVPSRSTSPRKPPYSATPGNARGWRDAEPAVGCPKAALERHA